MWPPTVDEVIVDLRSRGDVAGFEPDQEQLRQVLDAAVAFVERVHAGAFNFADESGATLPDVPDDIRMGTIRLAGRWHTRRRSPDALIQMGELGAGRVPSFDADIDRMLRIGRFRMPVIA